MQDHPVVLSGPVTVTTAPSHRRQLLEGLARSPRIALDLAGVDDADVSLVQLLVSAAATAASRGGGLRVTCTSTAVAAALKSAGLSLDRAGAVTVPPPFPAE